MEEGGLGQGTVIMKLKDDLRDYWRKLVDSEERLNFFKKMVSWDLLVREIEHFGDDLNNELRSEKMRGARSEKEVVRLIMKIKLKDERRYQRETRQERKCCRDKLEKEVNISKKFKEIVSKVNNEAKHWRKLEKSKYQSKIEHIKKIRREEK